MVATFPAGFGKKSWISSEVKCYFPFIGFSLLAIIIALVLGSVTFAPMCIGLALIGAQNHQVAWYESPGPLSGRFWRIIGMIMMIGFWLPAPYELRWLCESKHDVPYVLILLLGYLCTQDLVSDGWYRLQCGWDWRNASERRLGFVGIGLAVALYSVPALLILTEVK